MGQIPLRYNAVRRQFLVTAGIALGVPGEGPGGTLGHWIPNEFIFDSGSNRTSITERVAEHLGVEVEGLPLVDVGGVTGVAKRPFLPAVDIWFLGDEFRGIRLPGVTILRVLREKRIERRADLKHEAVVRLPAPSLLGTDAVDALGARVVLDFRARAGRIEW